MARSVYIDGYTNSYKDHNTSNTSSDDNFDNINDVEDIIASLQEPVASVFAKLGVQFKQFISEDYELDDNGYVYLYPDTLWNGGPVEDDFIRKNWMPRKDDIILAPALLINPETEDIIFLVGYEDEDNDQVEYKVQYSSEVEFARDFVRMFNYAKNHHETYDQIICHLMKGARKL